MSKQRQREYKGRIDQALATPKLQDALHQFGDAYLLAREKAFAGYDFEEMRSEIAAMKDGVRENSLSMNAFVLPEDSSLHLHRKRPSLLQHRFAN